MRVLITGGATWVKIDKVRILTNIFTGKTSLFLAKYFLKKKAKVTLLINPHCIEKFPQGRNIKIIFFRYFDELKKALREELKKNKYDAIIHTAAVSDYALKRPFKGKIPSNRKRIELHLQPTQKLTTLIRSLAKNSFLVQFKLETKSKYIIKKAYRSLTNNRFNLVVANVYRPQNKQYSTFIIDSGLNITKISSLRELAQNLFGILSSFK